MGLKEKNRTGWIIAALIGVTALAALLRFYSLGEWSLWQDEVYTWRDARKAMDAGLLSWPISYQMIGYTISFLGPGEWNLRLYPALVGILTIPILFIAIRKLLGSSTALISVSLIAVSHWHLYWSQNARFYTSLMLFYGLALIALIHWLENPRKKTSLIAAILFLILATQERLVALLSFPPVFFMSIFLIYLAKPTWRTKIRLHRVLLAIVAIGCLFVAFSARFILDPSAWVDLFGWANNSAFWLAGAFSFYVGVPTVFMAGVGAYCLYRERPIAALTLASAATVPILLLLFISPFHYTASRYAFVSLPAWLILAAFAIDYFWQKTELEARILAVAVFLTLAFFSLGENYLYFTAQKGNRPDWKSAFQYLLLHKKEEDRLFMTTPLVGEFYLNQKPEAIRHLDVGRIPPNQRIWFIEDMTTRAKNPRKLAWIQEHAREVADFDVQVRARNFRMRVYHYDAPAHSQTKLRPQLNPTRTSESSSETSSTSIIPPDHTASAPN